MIYATMIHSGLYLSYGLFITKFIFSQNTSPDLSSESFTVNISIRVGNIQKNNVWRENNIMQWKHFDDAKDLGLKLVGSKKSKNLSVVDIYLSDVYWQSSYSYSTSATHRRLGKLFVFSLCGTVPEEIMKVIRSIKLSINISTFIGTVGDLWTYLAVKFCASSRSSKSSFALSSSVCTSLQLLFFL